MPEFEFKTIDTVVQRSSSDWNLRIYLPCVEANPVQMSVYSAAATIRNWNIERGISLSVTETSVNNCVLGIVQPFCNPFYDFKRLWKPSQH